MPEAIFVRDWDKTRIQLAASTGAGELRQLSDGRAGFYQSSVGASTGDFIIVQTSGQVSLAKTNGIVLLDGGRAYWDHSANAVHFKPVNDRDFYIGTVVGDYQSGDTQVVVNLNAQQENLIDLIRDAWDTATVGTHAAGGFGDPKPRGGAYKFVLSSTSEAQKVDMLSQRGFAPTANAIVEAIFNVVNDGSGSAPDFSLFIANETHASNADTIAESCGIHLDGNDVNIYAESDDGSVEVAATDTTVDYTAGTPVEVWIDTRNPADIQIYLDGVLVLGASTFRLDSATGPLKGLIHLEKSSAADVYEVDVNRFVARLMEQ